MANNVTNLAPNNNQNNSQQNEKKIFWDKKFDEKSMFFTNEEMAYFRSKNIPHIINTKSNDGMPYINYDIAKYVFENVVGHNYDVEILAYEYNKDFETFMVHVRITVRRGDKTIKRDVIGCETVSKRKESKEVFNWDNLPKMAVKDALKKFYSDYIGIGAAQYMNAKNEYDAKVQKDKKNKTYDNSGKTYKCADCGAEINQKIHDFSMKKFNEILCLNCQKKH